MYPVLAHGTLGAYDEVLFTVIALIFLVMMGISWLRSRNLPPIEETPEQDNPAEEASDSKDHFELR